VLISITETKTKRQFKYTYICGCCAKWVQSTELVYVYVLCFIISNTTNRFMMTSGCQCTRLNIPYLYIQIVFLQLISFACIGFMFE